MVRVVLILGDSERSDSDGGLNGGIIRESMRERGEIIPKHCGYTIIHDQA